jgi:hypothetical protein
MGWRFRKTVYVALTRFNLTRRGLSASWRLPGFRIGVNAQRRWYISFGIPGTGFYWIKQF